MNVDGTFREYFGIFRLKPPNYTTSSTIVDFTDNGTNFYTIFNGDVKATGDLTVGGDVGATGDLTVGGGLTVGGVLDVTPRRCYATLGSTGWYRVLKYSGDSQNAPLGAPSFIIRFGITRHVGSANGGEAHEITMTAAYNGSIMFSNEISNSKELIIDKIRYTYSGNDAHVDIHYNNSGTNIVAVDFDVDARQYVKQEIVSQPFVSVATSPSGETVLAEYSFVENTDAVGSLTLGDYGTVFGSGDYIRTINGVVYLRSNIKVTDTPSGGWRSLFTIPTGFKPLVDYDFLAIDNTSDTAIHARANSNGTVSVWPSYNIPSGRIIQCYVIYPIV
jgi:hypothetical protein